MVRIDQFTAANEAAIEQFSKIARTSLANVEKFSQMGIAAARESVVMASKHAQALSGARDLNEVVAINQAALEPALKRAYTLAQAAFESATETNAEIKRDYEKQ